MLHRFWPVTELALGKTLVGAVTVGKGRGIWRWKRAHIKMKNEKRRIPLEFLGWEAR